jgi:hypothetical protein
MSGALKLAKKRLTRIVYRGISDVRTFTKDVLPRRSSLEVVACRVDRELPTAQSEIDVAPTDPSHLLA